MIEFGSAFYSVKDYFEYYYVILNRFLCIHLFVRIILGKKFIMQGLETEKSEVCGALHVAYIFVKSLPIFYLFYQL